MVPASRRRCWIVIIFVSMERKLPTVRAVELTLNLETDPHLIPERIGHPRVLRNVIRNTDCRVRFFPGAGEGTLTGSSLRGGYCGDRDLFRDCDLHRLLSEELCEHQRGVLYGGPGDDGVDRGAQFCFGEPWVAG